MKRQLFAALCAAFILGACGGSNESRDSAPPSSGETPAAPAPQPGPGPAPQPQPQPDPEPEPQPEQPSPVPTPVGTVLGTPASTVIGPEGGELISVDGTLTINVPAGAFASEQTVSIQTITNEAHGGRGRAYRLRPEGLDTPVPITLHFRYSAAELRGSVLEELTIGYQNAAGIWYAYPEPSVDATTRTLSVQTKHFSDWAMLLGTQIVPHTASVRVGQSLSLQVIHCERVNRVEDIEDLPIPTPVIDCQAAPTVSFLTDRWSVNGTEGGGAQFGTVVADADRWAGKATYTAPAAKPARNTVAVSARHRPIAGPGELTLVANVTIVDDASDCSAWRDAQTLDAELSFDEFSFSDSWPHHQRTGYHAGRLVGTLRKGVSTPTLPFDFWSTVGVPLSGLRVVIDDTIVYNPPSGEGWTDTYVGSGRPYEEQGASSIALKINYDTCTFDLFGAFFVDGTFTHNGAARRSPLPVGGLYVQRQTIPPEQMGSGFLQGNLPVGLIGDTDQIGYFPHDGGADHTYIGGTTARWQITRRQ